jgi:hypothetical protein
MSKQSDAQKAEKAAAAEAAKIAASPIVAGVTAPHVQRIDQPVGATQQIIPPSGAPSAQMVKVKEVETGRVFAAWPVDARELVTHPNQEYVYATPEDEMAAPQADSGGNPVPVPPADGQAPVAVDPVPSPSPRAISEASARAALEDQSKADLKKLAQRANIDDSGSKEELVDRLTPHAAAGTISVGGPQSIGLPPSQNR